MDIDTSLLRERFVIEEKDADGDDALRIVAVSNRIVLDLQAGGLDPEYFVIRTNAMHSAVRLAARIVDEYDRRGPLTPRRDKIKWEELWHDLQSDFDLRYNQNAWCSLFFKGKALFSSGEYHPFFNVIEQCDAFSQGDYKKSIPFARDVFGQAGKDINIDYDSNVALVAKAKPEEARFSMLQRARESKATFHMNLSPRGDEKLQVTQLLTSAADFLEGTQLCYIIGEINEKIEQNIYEKFADEHRQGKHAQEQLVRLNVAIDAMENRYTARYRPERPDFELLTEAIEKETRETLYSLDDGGYGG